MLSATLRGAILGLIRAHKADPAKHHALILGIADWSSLVLSARLTRVDGWSSGVMKHSVFIQFT